MSTEVVPAVTTASSASLPKHDLGLAGSSYLGDLPSAYRRLFWAVALILGLLRTLDARYEVSADGISYIEMGDAYFRGDWKMAINAYWSPLYSWLIVLPKHLFGLSLYYEPTSVHLVNFLIFVGVLFSFEFFLSNLLSGISLIDGERLGALQPWALRLIGYSLFLYSAAYWLSTDVVSPDLCVEGLVLLAAGIILQIARGGAGWANFAKLGVILGIGYLTKVVLFPLAFVFLLCCFFAAPNRRQNVAKCFLAFLIFLLIATPYILVLSRAKGRFTYGDVGKIAYATYVDGVPLAVHWQGAQVIYGTPVHATRKVLEHPAVFEFAQPVGGSYPAWYDPSYWYEGIAPKFDARKEAAHVHQHLHFFVGLLSQQGEIVAGFLALFLIASRRKVFFLRWLREAFVWVPAIVALGAYTLIHLETRFLPGFLLLFWLSLFAALVIPDSAISWKVAQCVSLAIVLTVGARVLWTASIELGHLAGGRTNISWNVAEQLRRDGVQPGDKVGSIGFAFDGYWAHLAGVTIVAEIPESDAGAFWIADPETKERVLNMFAKFGAKAVVSNRVPPYTLPPGWTLITGWAPSGNASYFVRPIGDTAAR